VETKSLLVFEDGGILLEGSWRVPTSKVEPKVKPDEFVVFTKFEFLASSNLQSHDLRSNYIMQLNLLIAFYGGTLVALSFSPLACTIHYEFKTESVAPTEGLVFPCGAFALPLRRGVEFLDLVFHTIFGVIISII
jgi:hypothetical protein